MSPKTLDGRGTFKSISVCHWVICIHISRHLDTWANIRVSYVGALKHFDIFRYSSSYSSFPLFLHSFVVLLKKILLWSLISIEVYFRIPATMFVFITLQVSLSRIGSWFHIQIWFLHFLLHVLVLISLLLFAVPNRKSWEVKLFKILTPLLLLEYILRHYR